jgi:hypothetical protein
MLQLEINPIVLETLQKTFPKPKNSAQKALDKYIKLLTQQLSRSILLGRNLSFEAEKSRQSDWI